VVVVAVIPAAVIVVVIVIGGNSGTGCAPNGTADNRAIPSAHFIAHGGANGATHTAADGRVEGIVIGDPKNWVGCQNHGDN